MVGHLGKLGRRLACRQLFGAAERPTNAGDPLNPAPPAQIGHLAGRCGGSWAGEDLHSARAMDLAVTEPLEADKEVSANRPPQPPQPLAAWAFGCHTDAPFCASRRLWCLDLRARWRSCEAAELTFTPLSTGVQTGSERGCARASDYEGPRGPLGKKNGRLCMAPPPFVVARVSVRVRFYHLTAHLKGLACVPCVFLLSENHHI